MRQMRLLLVISLILAVSLPALADPHDASLIRPGPRADFEVFVWPDRGVDAIYHPGDQIKVYFEVTRDCYVVLYDIDTRGRLHILFPFSPWQDNYVEAGRVYEVPGNWDNFSLYVEGPTGTEYIEAIASPYSIDLPDWPIYLDSPGQYPVTCPDPVLRDFRAGQNRLGYISRVNRRITGDRWDWCATDLARFYVHPRIYRPHPPVIHPRPIIIDPWPDIFIEVIYIGWPVGGRIYVDGVYYGTAPLRVRGIRHGQHRIECYHKGRLVRSQRVEYRHKRHWEKQIRSDNNQGRHRSNVFRKVPKAKIDRIRLRSSDRDSHRIERSKHDLRGDSRVSRHRSAGRSPRKPAISSEKREISRKRAPREMRIERETIRTKRKSGSGRERLIEDAGRLLSKSLEKTKTTSRRGKTTMTKRDPHRDSPRKESKASPEKKRRKRRR